MADFDSSYDSGSESSYDSGSESSNDSNSESSNDSSYESVSIGDTGDYDDGAFVDVTGDNDVEIAIQSGPEIGTEIDNDNERGGNSLNSFDISIGEKDDFGTGGYGNGDNLGKVYVGDGNGDNLGKVYVGDGNGDNLGKVYIGDENGDINSNKNVDETKMSKSNEDDAEQENKENVGKVFFEGEEKINEYINSLPDDKKAKQIEALEKMSADERAIYAKSIENEPRITNVMQEVAQKNGAELQGLEFKLKTPSSTYEKMNDRKDSVDIKDMNDIIRYTEIYSSEKLAEGTNASLEDLKSKGFEVTRVKNTWDRENAPYRGINAVVKDPEGQTFELQFHTQESFDLKNGELHSLYEERRTMADDDPRAVEIDEKMIELSSKLERPQNINEVKNV